MVLIKFLESILEYFYSITASYGWSIILLSLAVTILMLPLFWLAEMIQNIERARKLRMQPALSKLKDVTHNMEKYYYTRTIYRQYNYHPIYSLSGLLGLFFQIPFFLAAFWMLTLYGPLNGVSFGPIRDLSKPDGLIAVSGFSLNVLPLLMTVANIASGYLYAKGGNKGERVQLWVIAVVFFALLYNVASGIVLYWTMNNVFAIAKNELLKKSRNSEPQNRFFGALLRRTRNWSYLLFPLMLAMFPLLAFYFGNITEASFSSIALFIPAILAATLILLLLFQWILKDRVKAALLTSLVVVLFFSYGHLFQALAERGINLRHSLLLLAYGSVFVAVGWLLLKTRKKLDTASRIVKMFSASIFFVVLFQIILHDLKNLDSQQAGALANGNDIQSFKSEAVKDTAQHPDIYFLMMDGYANSNVLRKYHGYDNSPFENYLKTKGFYVASEAKANYVATFLSLAATLNMKYINDFQKNPGINSQDKSGPYGLISRNEVMRYLLRKGYTTVNFGSGYIGTNKLDYAERNLSLPKQVEPTNLTFLQTTIIRPFASTLIKARQSFSKNILYTLDGMPSLDSIRGPKFVFGHVVCPHPPYVFTETGGPIPGELKIDNTWNKNEKQYYIAQIKYLNRRVEQIVESILQKSPNAVIVLQSDHGSAFFGDGSWERPDPELIVERGKVFNAILLNKKDSSQLYQNISLVNTFRVIFNSAFNEKFELLKDATYFSPYNRPYDFNDVTKAVDGQ
ncbi:membrane protein insertase YidC [Flaviaesturariibacter amylovorans]|uniref:Membrane protein insertase YidC n=1 Tax=Flaviaesturariibacter amylovorans TaxID=1084520 RepID=A0ABP8GDL1_9BACT